MPKQPRTRSLDGCATCRSRRVKCDETRPVCTSCQRLGLPCRGYESRLTFVEIGRPWATGDLEDGRYRRPLFTEKERLVMSNDLRTSMRRTPADRVIAKLDDQSQQLELSEQNDAVVHGPFAVFKCAQPVSSVTVPDVANEEDQILSEFLPDMDTIPDVVDFGDEQFVAALSAIDQMFDPEQQPYPDGNEQCGQGLPTSANPTDSFLTPYLNPYPESMAHQDASLLLNHYKTHVIRLLSPLKYQRKTPWNILQLPCAMTTLAEITMGYRANHARASVFYGVMSISAFNLSASSTSTAKAHWHGIASSYRLQAHESLKASLEYEMSPQKKAKYKEMLMAVLCMVTISAFSGAVENTRAYLLDAERLIRLRGLTKPRISRKIRLLHHCYAYIRLMHETTSPSSNSAASPFRITDWHSSFSPSSSSLSSTPPSSHHDVNAAADADEHSTWHREKPFDLGVHDLHLAVPGDFAKHTLYPDVYGISESLMLLISQTTRLGNEREAMMNDSPSSSSPPTTASPALFFRRAKAVERAICRLRDDDDEDDGDGKCYDADAAHYPPDADPAAVASNRRALAHLARALRAALAVYFYRRVHDVADPGLLRPGVESTIEHLERVQREDEEAAAAAARGGGGGGEGQEESGYTTGIVWPGFVAACEAEGRELRGRFERWFEVQEGKSGMPTFGKAREVVRMVWARRDAGGGKGRGCSWVDVVRERGVTLLCT